MGRTASRRHVARATEMIVLEYGRQFTEMWKSPLQSLWSDYWNLSLCCVSSIDSQKLPSYSWRRNRDSTRFRVILKAAGCVRSGCWEAKLVGTPLSARSEEILSIIQSGNEREILLATRAQPSDIQYTKTKTRVDGEIRSRLWWLQKTQDRIRRRRS